ncbi:MAG: bifunctional glutamate N-acetyltransferase/amino-acid acetyltransferase ArgJ [Nitrospiraceae bacterium]|nr:bifunctional glutamate N-acetyltransferase/amino-acid acetyltransferase ArgJ [Nitrospiraceae bacterium]
MKNVDPKNLSVPGFKVWGIHCGIKKTDKKDLALIVSDREGTIAGVFTKNRVKAASVVLDAAKAKSGKGQVIIANSGCANACTGKQGMIDAKETVEIAAQELGVKPELVYVASTGVIGEQLPVPKIRTGIATAVGLLTPAGWGQAAEAIMTTDLYPKTAAVQEEIGGKTVTVAGIAKGSGMIHPDMATMLCFIVTDAAVPAPMLRKMLADSADRSFNCITVDGDTSTNDLVLALANGAAGNRKPAPGSKDAKKFQACLDSVMRSLAMQVVKDGEGATKFIEVTVRGAKNPAEAQRAAYAIGRSALVKTAIFGEDANWGRIMAVLGSCGVDMEESRTDISFGGKTNLVEKGVTLGKQAEKEATAALKQREVRLSVDLHKGKGEFTIWTCDLSYEYVKINAAYRS